MSPSYLSVFFFFSSLSHLPSALQVHPFDSVLLASLDIAQPTYYPCDIVHKEHYRSDTRSWDELQLVGTNRMEVYCLLMDDMVDVL